MTFGSSVTGIDNSIPKIRGRKWDEKNPFPKFGTRPGMNVFSIIREREGIEKPIPEIWEREGNEKIHSYNSRTGSRGFHSQEWTGMGIPAHP